MRATTVTPPRSSEPSSVVSHGPRSGLRQNSGRNGPGGRLTPRPSAGARTSARRPRTGRTTRSPAHCASARIASASTRAQSNQGPTAPAPSSRTPTTVAPPPGGSTSTIASPPGRSSSAVRDSSRAGSPPIPTLPSRSSTLPHAPAGTRSEKTLARSARPPRRRASRTATGETSIPVAGRPWTASAASRRPGPQPTSSTGAAARSSASRSTASAGASQRRSGSAVGRPATVRTRPSCSPPSACSSSRP